MGDLCKFLESLGPIMANAQTNTQILGFNQVYPRIKSVGLGQIMFSWAKSFLLRELNGNFNKHPGENN